MILRIDGQMVEPSSAVPRSTDFGHVEDDWTEVYYDLRLSLNDLTEEFYNIYKDNFEFIKESNEALNGDKVLDESISVLEYSLFELNWPSLDTLLENDVSLFEKTIQEYGYYILTTLNWPREGPFEIRYGLNSVDFVKVEGNEFVLTGTAVLI
jgi:hypothetical protein